MNTETEFSKKTRKRRTGKGFRALLIAAVIVVLLGGTFGCYAAYVNGYDKIYPGVVLSGVEVGGKTVDEAKQLLDEKYGQELSGKEIELKCRDASVVLTTEDLEAKVDTDMSVDAAYRSGREGGFFARANAFLQGHFSSTELEVTTSLNEEKLRAEIDTLAAPYETPKKDYTYQINGTTLTIFRGSGGVMVDRDGVVAQVKQEIDDLNFAPIEMEPVAVEPEALNIDEFYAELTSPAEDAQYVREDGKIVIQEGKPQIAVDRAELETLIASNQEEASMQVTIVKEGKTKADLEAAMFRDTLGSYSTNYSASNKQRSANVALSASRINGTVLLPGETFSYDKTVGSRTKANGYQDAPVYVGNKVESGVGGGICQTSSTLYAAVLYSNLEIVSRTSHSLPVSYLPAGMDATIAEGSIDFKFRNDTAYPVKIVASAGSGKVSCSLVGTKETDFKVEIVNTKHSYTDPPLTRETDASIPVGTKKIKQNGAGGYSASSVRIVRENGVEVKRENLPSSRYNPTPKIEIVNPADVNTPSDQLSVYKPGSTPAAAASPSPSPSAPPAASAQPAAAESPAPSASPTPTASPAPAPSAEPSVAPAPSVVELD